MAIRPLGVADVAAIRELVLFSLLAFSTQASCFFDPGCGNTLLQDVPSPDGRRHAVVFERSCGATTGFSTQVSVVPSVRDLRGSGNVFTADTDHGKAPSGPGGGPIVTVRWIDRRTLEIGYDSAARVFGHEARHDDTDIRYVITVPSPEVPSAQFSGCYRLTWHTPVSGSDSSAFTALPSRFELSLVSLPAPFSGHAVYPAALWPRTGMPASWMRSDVHDESLMIRWTTGFHGIELRVDPRGDSLVGRARPLSDEHVRGEAPPPEADVVAVRVPCSGGV